MELTTEQYERISRFLDADMTLKEMEEFEKELSENPKIRNQLDFEQSVRDSFAFKKSSKITAQEVTVDDKQYMNDSVASIKTIHKRKWLSLAVAASVLAAVITIVLVKTKEPKQASIVQGNTTHGIKKKDTAELVITPRVNDSIKTPNLALLYKQYFVKDILPETYPMLLAEALTNYETGNYTSIQKLNLSNISETRGTDERNNKQDILELGHYYKGIAFLETNKGQQAITNLQWVIQHSANKLLVHKAEWYLALAFVKAGNREKGIRQLKAQIANKSSLYNEKAKNLMKELK